jgi:hypothetical protein
MPKVSLLWALCGAIDLALPALRYLLFLATLSLPVIPPSYFKIISGALCAAWAAAFAVDRLIDRITSE